MEKRWRSGGEASVAFGEDSRGAVRASLGFSGLAVWRFGGLAVWHEGGQLGGVRRGREGGGRERGRREGGRGGREEEGEEMVFREDGTGRDGTVRGWCWCKRTVL